MYKFVAFSILTLALLDIRAQSFMDSYEIGYQFDCDGNPFEGYYDFDYTPKRTLRISYEVGEDYTPGCYYTIEGEKIEGYLYYLKYRPSIRFKKLYKGSSKKINSDKCLAFIIGVDSFTVVQNYIFEGQQISFKNNEFVEVLDAFDNLSFHKLTKLVGDDVVSIYLVKKGALNNYYRISDDEGNLTDFAVEIFGEFEWLAKRIKSGRYNQNDLPVLIKYLKYYRLFINKEPIYYNKSWDETDDSLDYLSYAIIDSINNSLFYLKFYSRDDIPLFSGGFASFYPHKRAREFCYYFPNGNVRRKTFYERNMPKSTTIFYSDGSIHKEFNMVENQIQYVRILNPKGENILDAAGNGSEELYDSINNRMISLKYENFQLKNAYYTLADNQRIYLLCDQNLSKKVDFIEYFKEDFDYPSSSIRNSSHGFMLLRCTVDPDGYSSNVKLIKGIDPACDSIILDFIPMLQERSYWRPGIVDNVKVTQEVIFAIDFSITGFSRYRSTYIYNTNNYFMYHQMHNYNYNYNYQPQIPANFPKY